MAGSDNARSNGRLAASYVPLVDVDPRLADLVLDTLREREIAAYASPTTGQQGSLVHARIEGPLDRVYVDTAAFSAARQLLDEQLPRLRREHESHAELDEDAAWAEIVAGFNLPAAEPLRPADSSLPADSSRLPDFSQPPDPLLFPEPARPAEPPPPASHEPGDHFVPPPPPPLPRADPLTRLGWAGLLGGPLLLVLGAFVGLPVDGWLGLLLVGAFLGGFGVLLARMRTGEDDGSDPDDGAVV